MVAELAREIREPYQVASNCLGPSKIAEYLRCGKAYDYKYRQKIRMPSSQAALVGSTVHKVIQQAHARHWTTANMDDAADTLDTLWGEVTSPGAAFDDQTTRALKDAKDVWLPWYLQFAEEQLDIAVEERWQIEVPGLDVPLQGTIDRVYRASGETVISDVKTGKRAPSATDLATDLQLSIYSWAYRRMSRQNREDALEIVHIRSRSPLRTYRSDDYLNHVIHDIVIPVGRQIASGVFPANPQSKYGCSYCDYTNLCPIGGGSGNAPASGGERQ